MTSNSFKYDKKLWLKIAIPVVFLIGCLVLFGSTVLSDMRYHWYVHDVSDSMAKSDRLFRATNGKEGTYAYYNGEVCVITLENSNKFYATLVADTYTRPAKGAAHILGRVSRIYAEDWESYRDKGYSMDALVGKGGVEEAFEEFLHG
ncbi:MAG: hypothetical protein II602_05700, partial [Erysipelotrichales bacterium]|nr:hypothetical protein [Erysipelotrichales bacterium]